MVIKKKFAPTKSAPAKPKTVVIPPNPTRVYGSRVFSVTTKDKEKAAELVGVHGFRLFSSGPDGFELYADPVAFASYKRKA
jgi:hypothetical protein